MDSEESFIRAQKDVCAMMEKWAEDGIKPEESLFAALPILIRAVFELAPSVHAAHGMIAGCFAESYDPKDMAS